LERVAGLLRSADAQVERALPAELGDGLAFYETYLALLNAIVTRNLPDDVRVRSVAALLANGDSISAAKARGMQATAGEYIAWHDERERFRAAFREFFRSYDVLLAPVTVCVAYPHETRRWLDRRLNIDGTEVLYDLLSVHASLATFTGQPATTFPVGLNSAGLPIGLQAIGPYLEDLTPIRLASLFEREFGGVVRPPLAEAISSVPS
jgi:amidase